MTIFFFFLRVQVSVMFILLGVGVGGCREMDFISTGTLFMGGDTNLLVSYLVSCLEEAGFVLFCFCI